jgi:diadenosine tetraphosphate (Ap4A) HIT family hydrolase
VRTLAHPFDGGHPVDCPFCPKPELDATVAFQDDLVAYVVDERHQGALKHSGLIVPRRHAETVFDLTEAEALATFRMLARVKAWLDERVAPDGYTLGWNCGAVGGQEVFHAHLHVLPRFRQEPFAGKGLRAWLKTDANRW